jgi:hypothetical protein
MAGRPGLTPGRSFPYCPPFENLTRPDFRGAANMAAITGARMEVVPSRRVLTGVDHLRLAGLLAAAVAVHAWLLGHTAVTARDGIGFARYALALQSPHAANPPPGRYCKDEELPPKVDTPVDVIRRAEHPPGYPVAVWLTAKVVRNTTDLPLPESTLLAARLASAFAGVLLVVPMYLLGRMLFGRNIAFAAALLFQVLPVPARVTSDGLTEGVYLLGAVTALTLGVRAVRRPAIGGFLSCGVATGCTYLVRPEGLMVAAAVGLVAGWLGLVHRWPRSAALGRLAALGVGVALVAAPYILLIGKVTNKPAANQAFDPLQKRFSQAGDAAPVGGPLFASWWKVRDGAGPVEIVLPAVTHTIRETTKAMHYAVAGLAVAGLIALRRRILAEPGLAVLIALAGVNLAVLIAKGSSSYFVNGQRTFYLSERYTLLLVVVGCYFAAAALEPLTALLSRVPKLGGVFGGRLASCGLLAAVVASALPTTLKPMHAQREGFKHAGEWFKREVEDKWLAENDGKEKPAPYPKLIDPFEWAGWYSGRTLYFIPPCDPPSTVVYAIIDNKAREEDHERLPRLDIAKNVARDGRAELVYSWPENVHPKDAAVHVYRLDERAK